MQELIKALAKAKASFPEIPKTKENPYFKNRYADLASINKAIEPVLAKNGLVIVQLAGQAGDAFCLETRLLHESGEFISSGPYPLPSNIDPQKMGSAITYARRYQLCALLNIAADDDDDGNASSQSYSAPKSTPAKSKAAPAKNKAKPKLIDDNQLAEFRKVAEAEGWTDESLESLFKDNSDFNSPEEITQDRFSGALNALKNPTVKDKYGV